MKRINYTLCILLAIFGLAAFFRFYKIDSIPPGLYIDEVSIGYNAYSILKTGKDEYGERYPLFFKSFGDYKMPLYVYAVAKSMFFFGKNEFAVRFPSALFGSLTVVVFYFFFKKLLFLDKNSVFFDKSNEISLIGTFLLAVSPWHIQFSRAGFEVTVAVFFYLLGCWLFLIYWERRKILFLVSCYIFFIFAVYTYHTFRLLSPLTFLITSVLVNLKASNKKYIIFPSLVFLILFWPVFQFSLTTDGSSRFAGTSAFTEYPVSGTLDAVKTFPIVFLKDYLSFFSFDYLFSFGDGIGRHQIPGIGLFYTWQIPFLFAGIYYLFKQKKSFAKKIIFGLVIIAPIVPAIARPSPHSLRVLFFVIPLIMIIAIGLGYFLDNMIRKKVVIVVLFFIIIFEFGYYLNFYYIIYPRTNIIDWGGGHKDVVVEATKYQHAYDHIVVDKNLSFASSYFHFYNSNLSPVYADIAWVKPKGWKKESVLYIRPYYGPVNSRNIVDTVYLSNVNKDVFAQFFEL